MVQKARDYQANHASDIVSLEELNLRPSVSKQVSRIAPQKSVVTVVSTESNGKRVAIAQEVIKKIGSPEHIQIALNHAGIAIGVGFTGDDNYFQLRKAANKAVIYSSQLVAELTEAFGLDFTNVTSVSFQDVTYLKVGSRDVAFVKMVRDEPGTVSDSTDSSPRSDEVDFDNEAE